MKVSRLSPWDKSTIGVIHRQTNCWKAWLVDYRQTVVD